MSLEPKSKAGAFEVCSACEGLGARGRFCVACAQCHGAGVFWVAPSGARYFWGENTRGGSLLAYHLRQKMRLALGVLTRVLTLTLLLYGLYFFLGRNFTWSAVQLSETSVFFDPFAGRLDWLWAGGKNLGKAMFSAWQERSVGALAFWAGLGGLMLLRYCKWLERGVGKPLRPFSAPLRAAWDPEESPFSHAQDISAYASSDTLDLLRLTLSLAYTRSTRPTPFHLGLALPHSAHFRRLLERAEINPAKWEEFLNEQISKQPSAALASREKLRAEVRLTVELKKLILRAWLEALRMGMERIEPEALAVALMDDERVTKFFHLHKLVAEDMRVITLWMRSQREAKRQRADSALRAHKVTNRAWTSRVTPDLDRFSYDLTHVARSGELGYVVKRERELGELMRILSRSGLNNALLLGDEGSGRDSIVKNLASLMVCDAVSPALQDKRLVVLDTTMLMAGASLEGELELRLSRLIGDLAGSANIVLYLPDLHNLTLAGSERDFDAAKILAPVLSTATFQVIGSTDFVNYHRYIEPRADLAGSFEIVRVEELSDAESLKVLAISAGLIERNEAVFVTYGALQSALRLSKRYINNRLLPGKAVDLLAETVAEVKRRGGTAVREEDVAGIVTDKTGIPVSDAPDVEAVKLLHLEERLHQRVIGQDNAVKEVAAALRRARVGMKKLNRPVGSFLFLGPTGVGKTELAKALAEVYFGSETAMIRLDMSEYQTVETVEKILGSDESASATERGGYLTEAVKHRPFSLILLDEIEKAHRQVLNIFLQVLDDGRLTDSLGRTVDFTNTIIIATSNVGSEQVAKVFVQEGDNARLLEMLSPYMLQHFSPEFLNRFTAQIVFHSLSEEDIRQILFLQLEKIAANLYAAQGIKLILEAGALSYLAKIGYSAEYGARHLERTLQEKLENLIAVRVLSGEIKRTDTLRVSAEDLNKL